MRLTIIGPENVYEHEVDPSMDVRDVKALIEAETSIPVTAQTFSTDSGVVLAGQDKPLSFYGLSGENATLFLTLREIRSEKASRTPGVESTDDDYERMRLQALGDPRLMAQLKQANPEFATAVQSGGARFKEMVRHQEERMREAQLEKERQIELLNADPYDIEAQKKIEEAIRLEAVHENMQHAMEYSPESFGHVTMLYINVEINGHPVKAFVDSGAQSTIISPQCAEACGIMRLLDRRFEGVAQGVGTAKILGRIHSAQIKLGNLHLPVAFSVLEGKSVDMLFGLDMLKRHQACIDLSTNTLRIGKEDIPFLPEHELPLNALSRGEPPQHNGDAGGDGSIGGLFGSDIKAPVPVAGPSGTSNKAPPPTPAESQRRRHIETLVGLGASPGDAARLLDAAGGNVDVAASMLFG